MLVTDHPGVLRQAIQAVRKGGTVSIPGVYGGMLDKVPFGTAFGKGITMKMDQTNMHNYMRRPFFVESNKATSIPATSSPTASLSMKYLTCTMFGETRERRSQGL